MAKKDFKQSFSGVDAFFSSASQGEVPVTETQKPISQPQPMQSVEPVEEPRSNGKHARPTYIFTLHLPKEWKDILADTAWERRNSVTGLLVEIIGEWLKAHNKI